MFGLVGMPMWISDASKRQFGRMGLVVMFSIGVLVVAVDCFEWVMGRKPGIHPMTALVVKSAAWSLILLVAHRSRAVIRAYKRWFDGHEPPMTGNESGISPIRGSEEVVASSRAGDPLVGLNTPPRPRST